MNTTNNKTRERRERLSVIQHTSMPATPLTADHTDVSPQGIPAVIDLTSDEDEDVVVVASVTHTLPVCLGTADIRKELHSVDLTREAVDAVINLTSETDEISGVTDARSAEKYNSSDDEDEILRKRIVCGVCLDHEKELHKTNRYLVSTICGHIFCNSCMNEAINTLHICPVCRKKLTKNQFHQIFI